MSRNDARPTRDQRTANQAWISLVAALRNATTPCDNGNQAEWWSEDPEGQRTAARLCQACPVLQECATYAVAARERWGVWGGMTEQDRQRERRASRNRAA